MMFRTIWMLTIMGFFVLAIFLQGCTFQSDGGTLVDDSPPAAPRGVYSVSGDGEVLISWYPNQERDLGGYIIYRGSSAKGEYREIGNVGTKVTSFVDDNVKNGITYYYAVVAYDFDNNESDLSPEITEDTPRPEGMGVKLKDYVIAADRSGFDFSNPERGPQAYDNGSVDIYFGVYTVVSVPYIYSDNDVLIQDLGYTDSMDEIDVSPTKGFTTLFVEAIIGHTYAFLTSDGHYAKVRITDLYVDWVGDKVRDAWMVFDWAYQLQPDNPDLAPKMINKSS